MSKESRNFLIRQARLYVGLTFLALSFICPFFGILIAQLDISIGWKASIIGLLNKTLKRLSVYLRCKRDEGNM